MSSSGNFCVLLASPCASAADNASGSSALRARASEKFRSLCLKKSQKKSFFPFLKKKLDGPPGRPVPGARTGSMASICWQHKLVQTRIKRADARALHLPRRVLSMCATGKEDQYVDCNKVAYSCFLISRVPGVALARLHKLSLPRWLLSVTLMVLTCPFLPSPFFNFCCTFLTSKQSFNSLLFGCLRQAAHHQLLPHGLRQAVHQQIPRNA